MPNIELRDMAARLTYSFGLDESDVYALLSGVTFPSDGDWD